MARLRQAEAASKQREGDGGLDAMRTALAATSAAAQSTPMDVGGASARHSALAQPSPRSGDAGRAGANAGKQVAQGRARAAIVRRGLCPGDDQWHGAGKCGWSEPDESRRPMTTNRNIGRRWGRQVAGWSNETVWPAGSQKSLRVRIV